MSKNKKKSIRFNVMIPIEMMTEIETVVDKINEKKFQETNKSAFMKTCIDYVLGKIREDEISIY